MGELSRKIGEKGEKLVSEFLSIIGWGDFQDDESINCHSPSKHKRASAQKERTTHGIDAFFSSRSQLQDFTLENIILSVKYTNSAYPVNPSSKFKEHLKDLAETVECFMKSDLRAQNNEDYEMSGIEKANDTGVLFWLSNHKESEQDIVSKVSNINLDKTLNFSTIHIVDNSRAAFIYNSINYIRNNFRESDYYFHYAFSSSNYKDPEIAKYGSVLPVEYLTSNIIPFRLIDRSNKKVSFCVASREDFSEETINRLLYLVSDVSQDFTGDFVFLFPEYDPLKDDPVLKRAKRLKNDKHKSLNIVVKSYINDFRNLINE
ncbi:GapS4a family protein [Psychromonas sp. PT13]|uniref:GapS4a family protein n=1 Tax=Psychromonas sp. PT13 TaxID=3439547 RepID=UPI003EBB8492